MQLYGLQYDIAWEDKPANFERIRDYLRATPPEPGSLVVLPEMYSSGFSMHVETIAEDDSLPAESFLAEIAREYGVSAVGGVVRQGPDGKGRNLAVMVGPDGAEVARYCKLHPFCYGAEHEHYRRGDELVVTDWGGLKVGIFICYDLRFPEAFRCAVRRGAELFVVIACWPAARAAHWRTLLQARAIENEAYVIGVNRIGSDPHLAYSGDSLIVNPRGELLADAADRPGWLSAAIEPDLVRTIRRAFPVLSDIRPEFLGAP